MKARRLFLAALPLVACQVLAGLDDPLAAPPDAGAGDTSEPDTSTTAEAGPSLSAYAAAVLADGPVAYWRFDEKAGVTCIDASGNGNAVSLGGPAVRDRPGLVSGPGASVTLGDPAQILLDPKFDFGFEDDFTIEFWVRPRAADGAGSFFTNLVGGNGTLVGSALYLSQKGPAYMGYERWANQLVRYAHAVEPVVVGARGLLHVVVVTRARQATLFIDGTKHGGYSQPSPATFTPSSLVFGSLPGDYDELAIYAKALPDVRVAAHYGAGVD